MSIHININTVQTITISKKKDSGLVFFEAEPDDYILFGLIKIHEGLSAGYGFPKNKHYRRSPIEDYKSVHYQIEEDENGVIKIYNSPTVYINHKNKYSETIYFDTDENLEKWVEKFHMLTNDNFIKLHE